MHIPVVLSIRGSQSCLDQDPEVIELVTEGVMEKRVDGWNLSYEESDLTGLQGVTTTFIIEPGKIILDRTGKLSSQMVFVEGKQHDSLYQMEFGALMLSVTATRVKHTLTEDGGTVDLSYKIEIEQTSAGMIDYHLDVRKK